MKNVPHDQLLPWCLSITSDVASLIHKFDAFHSKFSESHEGVQLFWEQSEPQNGYIVDEDEPNSVLRFIPTLWFSNLDTASMFFMYCAYSLTFTVAKLKDALTVPRVIKSQSLGWPCRPL